MLFSLCCSLITASPNKHKNEKKENRQNNNNNNKKKKHFRKIFIFLALVKSMFTIILFFKVEVSLKKSVGASRVDLSNN